MGFYLFASSCHWHTNKIVSSHKRRQQFSPTFTAKQIDWNRSEHRTAVRLTFVLYFCFFVCLALNVQSVLFWLHWTWKVFKDLHRPATHSGRLVRMRDSRSYRNRASRTSFPPGRGNRTEKRRRSVVDGGDEGAWSWHTKYCYYYLPPHHSAQSLIIMTTSVYFVSAKIHNLIIDTVAVRETVAIQMCT